MRTERPEIRGQRPASLRRYLGVAAAALVLTGTAARAQQNAAGAISLGDAIRMGEKASETVRVAHAGVDRARGQFMQARSQLFPQLTGTASYQRAIQSQFQEISKRLSSGDTSSDTTSGGAADFASSPIARIFAAPNTMILGLTGSQVIYAGGRVRAGISAAEAGSRAAGLGERAARAELVYQIAEAYFNAQVAERLLAIADSSLGQAERALRQTTLSREVGNTAEYDLIRARVQRDNARPAVIAARAQRDVAFQRLRQLLDIPGDGPLTLSTSIESAASAPPAEVRTASDLVASSTDTNSATRAVVRQADEAVRVQEAQLKAARGQRLPQISVTSTYQRFSYPSGVFEDRLKFYFPNWTASVGLSIPLLTWGRQKGEELVARANLAEAEARRDQVREAASLDARSAALQLEYAEATLSSSAGTDEHAARAYAIAEVRFNEGIGTQLELLQARVDLEQARANRVQAGRDVALARLKLALLQDLPLGVGPLATTQVQR